MQAFSSFVWDIRSRNIPALWLDSQLVRPDFYHFIEAAGIGKLKPEKTYGITLALGSAEVTMQELVQLYAMLANEGLSSLQYTKSDAMAASPRLRRGVERYVLQIGR